MNLFTKRLLLSLLLLILLGLGGTLGYYIISEGEASLTDCFYMTAITVTTIGYGEIIPLDSSPGGRIFTVILALFGVGSFTYIVTNLTALLIDRDVFLSYSKKRTLKMISKLNKHFIICGTGDIGLQIAKELKATDRPFVLIDKDIHKTNHLIDIKDFITLEGDATEDNILISAGIEKAKGIFAVTGDDNYNLVITFTARQLHPEIRIISKVRDIQQIEKIKRAGADSVISPYMIGGLRIVSEMVRPAVVSFLDSMMRDKNANLRVEEIDLTPVSKGKTLEEMDLYSREDILLLALRKDGEIQFNPPRATALEGNEILILMVSPSGRKELKERFGLAT